MEDPLRSSPGDWRPTDTDLVRAVAAILISNSHLEALYKPRSWMAGDGLLGILMFYFLSGFGVSLASKSRMKGFFSWLGRRIMRIYPAVFLATLVIQLGILGQWRTTSLLSFASLFLYPTSYSFVAEIMIVYLMLYWLLKARLRWPLILALTLTSIVSVACYAYAISDWPATKPLSMGDPKFLQFIWFGYASVALLGALFAPATSRPRDTFGRDATLLAGLFSVYVTTKYAMVHGHYPRWSILLFLMAIGVTLLLLRVSASDSMKEILRRFKPLGWAVSLLSGITLEMYIVQSWTPSLPLIRQLNLPMNLLVFWIVTITGAVILSKATALLVALAVNKRRTSAAAS